MTNSGRDVWQRALECLIRRPRAAERVEAVSTNTLADTEAGATTAAQIRAAMEQIARSPAPRLALLGEVYIHEARRAFRQFLDGETGPPPLLQHVRAHYDVDQHFIEFVAHFDRISRTWRLHLDRFERPRDIDRWLAHDHRRELQPHYDRLCRDHLIERQLRSYRECLRRLQEIGASPVQIDAVYRADRDLEDRLRRQQAPPLMFPDHAVNPFAGRRERNMTATEVLSREQTFVGIDYGSFTVFDEFTSAIPPSMMMSPEASAKALKLLQEWLTPEQAAQYKEHKHFEVVGCDTGKRYRICQGRQMNVYELGNNGKPVCGHCFTPDDSLAEGDAMLAQKVALETFERAALEKANLFHAYEGVARYAAMGDMALRMITFGSVQWMVDSEPSQPIT